MKNTYFFFFNDTATTEIYTLSLHDALPISKGTASFLVPAASWLQTYTGGWHAVFVVAAVANITVAATALLDRKSTRLNSSHANISYAVFCLKKKSLFLLCS